MRAMCTVWLSADAAAAALLYHFCSPSGYTDSGLDCVGCPSGYYSDGALMCYEDCRLVLRARGCTHESPRHFRAPLAEHSTEHSTLVHTLAQVGLHRGRRRMLAKLRQRMDGHR